MSCLNPWPKGQSFQKAETITPRVVTKHDKKAEKEKQLRDAYAIVDKRDAGKCRVTGVSLVAGAPDPKVRREHHHLRKRSTARADRSNPRNIVLVSAFAHQLIERGWLVAEGRDGNKPIFWHWSDLATSRPLKIKRHNPKGETP